MNSSDPDWWDLQAAEFVLRTLDASEQLVFEKILLTDAELRQRVRDWERRLDPLNDGTPPVQPSPAVWRGVIAALSSPPQQTEAAPHQQTEAALKRSQAAPQQTESAPPHQHSVVVDVSEVNAWRKRARNWKLAAFTGFATAAGIGALLLMNTGALRPGSPDAPVTDERVVATEQVADARPEPSISTVSVLQSEQQVPVWAITYRAVPGEPDDLVAALNGQLVITVVGPPAASDQQSYQLWVAHDDESVHSVGLLPGEVGESVTLDLPIGLNVADHFAVSLEPLGGSPEAGPTGPVLSSGTVVKPASGI